MKFTRFHFLSSVAGMAASTLLPWRTASAATASATPANPVEAENALPGATDWQLTRTRIDKDGFRSPWIEGYCSRQSVEAGESLDIMVSTNPARSFKIEIFRMGYYGGRGARLMTTLGPFDGTVSKKCDRPNFFSLPLSVFRSPLDVFYGVALRSVPRHA